mmetsp:Transcript_2737/g.4439  ORF Transcript_2737/g.4439 Transcript_2737/m.4439 type:complete len:85 (-) Transcript_2737:102-356(-)
MHSWLLLDLNAYNSQHSYAYMIVFAVLGWLYYVGSRLFLTPAKQPAVCFDEGPAGLKEAGEKLSTISPSMRTSPTDTATKECTD